MKPRLTNARIWQQNPLQKFHVSLNETKQNTGNNLTKSRVSANHTIFASLSHNANSIDYKYYNITFEKQTIKLGLGVKPTPLNLLHEDKLPTLLGTQNFVQNLPHVVQAYPCAIPPTSEIFTCKSRFNKDYIYVSYLYIY